MNDYDKAGRYLIKRDSAGFLRWLLRLPSLGFHAWIDARRLALPDQNDLTNDLVAAVRTPGGFEAVCVELEAEARPDVLPRLLSYEARLWTEPGDERALPLSSVGGVVLNLTGRTRARQLTLRPISARECRLELAILCRDLADEDSAELTAGAAAGELWPWALGWAPLMRRGSEAGIIEVWRQAAERRLTDEADRNLLGFLTCTFAQLTGCRPAWRHGLRRWNMKTSPFWDEIRAEGLEEGREKGRLEQTRALLLQLGRRKFGKAPTKKQRGELDAVADRARLESLTERLLDVDSWADLLNGG